MNASTSPKITSDFLTSVFDAHFFKVSGSEPSVFYDSTNELSGHFIGGPVKSDCCYRITFVTFPGAFGKELLVISLGHVRFYRSFLAK